MPKHEHTIRDFIYIDGDRLYSLYSQINKGVAERIVESRLSGVVKEKTQKGPAFGGASLGSQYSDSAEATEMKVLHDYVYVELEEQLGDSLLTVEGITPDRSKEVLDGSFLIKVNGRAEISDLQRTRHILKSFNEMMTGLHYMSASSTLGGNPRQTLRYITNLSQKELPNKAELLKTLKEFENPKKLAESAGVLQDEILLKSLDHVLELFFSDGVEITIVPKDSEVAYRAVIDSQWLRVAPEFLRHLYAGDSGSEWTLVGQVTHIPAVVNPPIAVGQTETVIPEIPKADSVADEADTEANQEPAVSATPRGAVDIMLKATRDIERGFMVNSDRFEIVVAPLAIYREATLLTVSQVPEEKADAPEGKNVN